MKFPDPISKLIDNFERLPGIGPKTAQRLTFQLLHFPREDLAAFAENLTNLKDKTKLCSICKNVSEDDICHVCNDSNRNKKKIVVVASSLDAFAVEKTGYKGVYHILHGIIDPLNNIGPDEIFIKELINRVKILSEENVFDETDSTDPIEIILATNSSMEGEATSMYITRLIRDLGLSSAEVKLSRIARGLPVGGDIEYADDITLSKALDGRQEV